jgi:hypothetical protein
MHQNEIGRLKAVQRFLKLEINRKQELQQIVEMTAKVCDTPIALITLLDEDTQYYKFKVGTDIESHSHKNTFCHYLLEGDETLVVADATKDERFVNSPFVANNAKYRFYAGVALITYDGYRVGTFCIIDVKPRRLPKAKKLLLEVLAKHVVEILEFELSLGLLKQHYNAAADAELKLQSFFESTGYCQLLIGNSLEILSFNKSMAVFLKRMYNVDIFPGIKVDQILQDKGLEVFISEYESVLKGVPLKYEREVVYPNEVIWWDVKFEPNYNPDGEVIGISYNATDITQLKQHEKLIIKQTESLLEIAKYQSHELRRPIANMLAFMELWKANNYKAKKSELLLLEKVVKEVDEKIRVIVKYTEE